MFARIVTMPLKPGAAAEFPKVIDKGVVPLLRKHKGFLDEIALITDNGEFGLGISFWDSKENAEAYNRSGYAEVRKVLEKVMAGPPELKNYEVTYSTAHKIAALVA